MGFQDNFPTMRAAEQAAFGSTITYTPAGGTPAPFTLTAIFENFQIDQFDARMVRDVFACRVTHLALAAGGVTAPQVQTNSQAGDSITRHDITGADEVWIVTQAEPDQDYGEWVLSLERDVRFVP